MGFGDSALLGIGKAVKLAIKQNPAASAAQTASAKPAGVNAPPPSIVKTGTTNTPGVFLTTTRQQRDINDVNTTPRNIMEWKDIK